MAGGTTTDHPACLVIDDEADQASINTGGNRAPLEELTDLSPADVDAASRSRTGLGGSASTAAGTKPIPASSTV